MLTPEQLQLRRQGLGGSDMTALSGLSKRWRPIDVWRSKVQRTPIVEEDAAETDEDVERGIFAEPFVRNWYCHRKRCWAEEPGTLHHPSHRLVLATPDGLVHFADGQPDRALEVKVPRSVKMPDWYGGPRKNEVVVPPYYVPQVLWEMAVLGVDKADVAVYLRDVLHIVEVPFDPTLYKMLRELGETFWDSCVVPNMPPDPDTSDSYHRYLADRYPKADEDILEPSGDILDVAQQLKEVQQEIRALESKQNLFRAQLKEFIGDHAGVQLSHNVKVTWTNNKPREAIDYPALLKHCGVDIDPETLEKFTLRKPGSRVFRDASLKNLDEG